MLVPLNVVEEWYKPNHMIRKSFNYLFQNPLWEKNIPKGFSVCPYFWMSILLSPLFRVFMVWPIIYMVIPMIRILRVGQADKIIYSRFKKGMSDYEEGLGFFMLFVSSVIGFGILFSISAFALSYFKMIDWLNVNNYSHGFFIASYFSLVGFILMIGASILWNKKNKMNFKVMDIECKHVVAAGILGYLLMLGIFSHETYISLFHAAYFGICSFCWMFATVCLYVWKFIVLCFSFIASLLTHDFLSVPLYLVLITALVAAFIVNYVAVLFADKIEESMLKEIDYFDQWVSGISYRMTKAFNYDKLNEDIDYMMCSSGFKCPHKYVDRYIRKILIKDYKDILDQVRYTKPESDGMKSIAREAIDRCLLHSDVYGFICKDAEVINEVESFKEKKREEIRLLRAKEDKRENNKFFLMMGSLSDFLMGNLLNGSVIVFRLTWRGFKSVCYNIFVFFCFIWELMKAQKKKACPYIRFKD